jgi:hypothetical protein
VRFSMAAEQQNWPVERQPVEYPRHDTLVELEGPKLYRLLHICSTACSPR